MNKKNIFIGIITLTLMTVFSFTYTVKAEDFTNQEDHYIKLCSSLKLTQKQQDTCQEFNTYLSQKNKELASLSKQTKNDLANTQKSIEDIAKELTDLDNKISTTKKELTYIEKSIKTLNQTITSQKGDLDERLYAMQTTFNSHAFTSYIFNAESFTDFFSRIINFKEITRYDNELIAKLTKSMNEATKQQNTLTLLKDSLDKDLLTQTALQEKYTAKLKEQNKELASQDLEVSKNQESIESIQKNLAALKKASEESKVNNVTQATPNKKPTPTKPTPTQPEANPEKPNTETEKPPVTDDPNTGNENQTPAPELSTNEELGLAIANKALTRIGYMYVWGGSHSWSTIQNPNQTDFDCSGLVNWAHYQCGVNLGRIHYTGSLVNAGKAVSRSNLQAGDIILFSDNGAVSGVHHVGIYIGNNQMVHAPTTGQAVQVANLNTNYWQREWLSCRRLY